VTFEGCFRYCKLRVNGFAVSISQRTSEDNYNGQTSLCEQFYFYCWLGACIQSEGLLFDAERDLLTIAKFLVISC